MRQRLVFVVAIAFACIPWAFAQGSGQSASQTTPNNPSPSGTNAQAGSNSNAVVTQYGSVVDRQFVNATPGVFGTPGVFPGIPMPSQKWGVYYSAVQHRWTMGQ